MNDIPPDTYAKMRQSMKDHKPKSGNIYRMVSKEEHKLASDLGLVHTDIDGNHWINQEDPYWWDNYQSLVIDRLKEESDDE